MLHRSIVAVERERITGPVPAGSATLYLHERPERVDGGCVRRRWIVGFSARDPARMDEATVVHRVATEEVGLINRGTCDGATFVGSGGPDRAHVLALLSALERWRAGPGTATLTCSTERSSAATCPAPGEIRAALMRAMPWYAPETLKLWATIDGRRGYTITFDALPATAISVEYRVPAPF